MTRHYGAADCYLAGCVMLPIVAAILLGRVIWLTVLALWEWATGDRR